ncbi:AraC family transcriptional regulator [uncultured Clostridium sp.]|uniref:helix-turn-helix domain-containing protein n=1 Tax=uncultured Clostridium sp. TaxID=59620 RepID=UPI0025D4329E|nr:AraC family transcriptional regulator [uncultured Clostridium sp.]
MAKLDCNICEIPHTGEGHAHSYAHILLPLRDSLTLQLDGINHSVTNQHLAFVPPDKFHHCFKTDEVIIMNIPAPMIKESDLAMLSQCVCVKVTELLVPLVELIKSEVRQNPESDRLRYLYFYLYEKLIEHHNYKSLVYIHEHFGEKITVAELARLENYNITYFTEWFHKKMGCTPNQYVRNLRIEKAKELLATTQYRIIDIAVQVGYANNASFTKAFKEQENCSPAFYRNNLT